jgi:hypothetical protein
MDALFAEWAEQDQNAVNFDCPMDWRLTASITCMLPMHGTPGFKN